jgi:adenine-specific DNA-methyltransferase
MASLMARSLAGKLQMIYIDPPPGIKFASNFQPRLGDDSKDRTGPTRSWNGQSLPGYLDAQHHLPAYLRPSPWPANGTDSGSIFVQIGGKIFTACERDG